MSDTYVGQILAFAGTFAPRGYVLCAGQLLPISQFDVLYNLIGTTYGGDGVNTFAVPDLRSRVPIHQGQGPGLSNYLLGTVAGVENVALISAQIPAHSHLVTVVTGQGSSSVSTPGSATYLADGYQNPPTAAYNYLPYSSSNTQVALAGNTIKTAGGGLPHSNIQPCQAILYCIAIAGVYPSQG
ncbi:microcystin dependent MdpB family protein [Labrys miyagiensis]|uniref:Microcystin dependent MdpB family protein n=1 Tax=Labrys miyagiensis TaxID=346912 RepID=A0ABQ6CJ31_9HYPH|nr:tail fiber protein [Labrys miyagiensis]GLS20281.1 microcystin dependent MdpB family protein [Labrys miyagiensis]